MIGPGTGVRVYLACGSTDMRKGIEGLPALAHDVLRQKATGGAEFAFCGKRGDRLKLLHRVSHWNAIGPRERRSVRHWCENTGARRKQRFCLCYKVLERGRFLWPATQDGAVIPPEIWKTAGITPTHKPLNIPSPKVNRALRFG